MAKKKHLEKLREESNDFVEHLNNFIEEIDELIDEGKCGVDCVKDIWSSLEDWFMSLVSYAKKNDAVELPETAEEVAEVIQENNENEE